MTTEKLAAFSRCERQSDTEITEARKAREESLDAIHLHMRENKLPNIDIGEWRYTRITDRREWVKTKPCHWGGIHPVRDGVWVTCPAVEPERLKVEAIERSAAA